MIKKKLKWEQNKPSKNFIHIHKTDVSFFMIKYIKNAILIETTNQVPSEEYSAFLNYLTTQGKRAIPMKEIGWAILTCSTHRYCNPLLNLEQTLFNKRGQASVQSDQLTILAPESQVAAQA